MSVAVYAPAEQIRIYRAPLIDPPFDDELVPQMFQPGLHEEFVHFEPLAVAGSSREGHSAALRFLNLCLELFNGFRSPVQMRPLLDHTHAAPILDELAVVARRLSHLRRRRPGFKVRRCQLRTCEPRPGALEVAAVLDDTVRTWAMCYRLERRHNVWLCSYLRVLVPEQPQGPNRPEHAPARAKQSLAPR